MKSFFKFNITQTVEVLLYKIKMSDGKRWTVENKDNGIIVLHEQANPNNITTIKVNKGVLQITTVHGFEYVVVNLEKDGAEVSFHGPVNALLTQSLLPRMTYVPETLYGMTEDMEDYLPIADFMDLREKRHGDTPNPQDKFGWKVNMKFDNELFPWLPPFRESLRDKQARKQKRKSGKFNRR